MKTLKINPEEVYLGDKFSFKVRHIFELAGLPVPDKLFSLKDEKIWELSNTDQWRKAPPQKDDGIRVLIAWNWRRTPMKAFERLIEEGALVITHGELRKQDGTLLDYVKNNNFEETKLLWISLGNFIRNYINIPTICVTGSVGKTTTTRLLQCIFEAKNKVFTSGGNKNIPEYYVKEMVNRENKLYDIHFQETAGGAPNAVQSSGRILEPNAFVITGILPVHLDLYKDLDEIEYDKCSLDIYAHKDGFGVINADDERLIKHKFKHKIITCGIKNQNADYVAQNIVQTKEGLKLQIKHNHKIENIKMNIFGHHNAYNILFACAVANNMGVDFDTIREGLALYHGDLVRNNLINVSGRLVYMDCFSINKESIMASLETISMMKISEKCKKIAVIVGHNHAGGLANSINYEIGLCLEKYEDSIDLFIIHGKPINKNSMENVDFVGDSYSVYRGALQSMGDKKVYYCDDDNKLVAMIKNISRPGDLILMRGNAWYHHWAVIDRAFGTSITIRGNVSKNHRVEDDNGWGYFFKDINAVNVGGGRIENEILKIPEQIKNFPTYRVGKSVFKGNNRFSSIEFGKSIVNIGECAFQDCICLKTFQLGENMKHIEKSAFENCIGLEKVDLSSVEHIEEKAFAGCKSLISVILSDKCMQIDKDAFAGCENLVITADKGSYAENWARENNISIKRNIMILFGGNSSEYEVSCLSAAGVTKNIDSEKYNVFMVGITPSNQWILTKASVDKIENGTWVDDNSNEEVTLSLNQNHKGLLIIKNEKIITQHIDCIFPILHGRTGEDGSIQGALQLSGIPYVGCGIQSSVIGFDKVLTKEIVKTIGVVQANSYTLQRDNRTVEESVDKVDSFFKKKYPLFVKPAREGSSVGISKVNNANELNDAIKFGFRYDNKLVIEEGIVGREIEVAILGNEKAQASPIGEIIANDDFYSYEAKYKSSKSKTTIVSDISDSLSEQIKATALEIYKILECKDLARVDFFLTENEEIVFNEINTMPGFTPISMYPQLWQNYGIGYSELISRLIESAIKR